MADSENAEKLAVTRSPFSGRSGKGIPYFYIKRFCPKLKGADAARHTISSEGMQIVPTVMKLFCVMKEGSICRPRATSEELNEAAYIVTRWLTQEATVLSLARYMPLVNPDEHRFTA